MRDNKTTEKIKCFQDLKIWQKGIQLVEQIYDTSKSFPKEEIYGLQSQIRRSAVSIPSNMAEGFARFHNKEYRNFLYIALGSCAELTTQIIIAARLKYIEQTKADGIISMIEQISKMTMSLIKKLNTND
jgi:four helix bundle protein